MEDETCVNINLNTSNRAQQRLKQMTQKSNNWKKIKRMLWRREKKNQTGDTNKSTNNVSDG